MLRARLVAPEKILLEKVDIPQVGEKEVLIKVKVCGICGSDIHSYRGKHPFVHPPIVLGHEFSGTVHRVGDGVKDFSPGDKVTVEPNIVCGKCYNCLHGRYNICANLKVIGCVGYDGAFEVSFEEAALAEPTAVALHAVRKAGQKIGDRVVILGAGTIGLLTLQVAKLAGAKEVIVTDLIDFRLDKAKDLGASEIINPAFQNVVSFIQEKNYGGGSAGGKIKG